MKPRAIVTPGGIIVPVSIEIALKHEHPEMPEWPLLPDRRMVRSVTVGEIKWTAVDDNGNAFDWQVEGVLEGKYTIRLASPREKLLGRLARAGSEYADAKEV